MYFFPNFEPVRCSVSGSNCCFLTFIQVSQETSKVIWYSHLFNNFPQFIVIHTSKALAYFLGSISSPLWAPWPPPTSPIFSCHTGFFRCHALFSLVSRPLCGLFPLPVVLRFTLCLPWALNGLFSVFSGKTFCFTKTGSGGPTTVHLPPS